MKILIADDSDLILDRLLAMLSFFNNVQIVGPFKNGTDALEALKCSKSDLAIVDLKMPGLSGLEVLKEIRKVDQSLKFILLTFFSTDYYRQMALQLGADYFISKADNFDDIHLIVENLNQTGKKI